MALSATGRNRNRIVPRRREPSGRYQRDREESEAVLRSVVLAQPHRRLAPRPGESEAEHRKRMLDDRRRWPIGRMILDGIVTWPSIEPTSLERAAELFAKSHADMQWLADARRPFFASVGGGRREPTPAQRAEIERRAGDIRRVLRDCASGERVAKALELAIIDTVHNPDFDERGFASYVPRSCAEGLAALVKHFGLET